MNIDEKVKTLTTIINDYLPHTDTLGLIHDRTHQELLRQLMTKLDENLHNESPTMLHDIMKHCTGRDKHAESFNELVLVESNTEDKSS